MLKILTDYVIEDNNEQPLILTGNLGCGKSSLISTFISNLFLQMFVQDGKYDCDFSKHSVVVRFIGIDGKSIYLRSLLKSVCLQLKYIKNPINEKEVPNKLTDLKRYFRNVLTENTSDSRKLVIVLDSLQDLTKNDNSYKLDWLPKNLGKNCKLVLSVSSESTELIKRLKRKYTDSKSYVNLYHLNKEQGEYMVRKLLTQKNFRLEPNQLDLISSLIREKKIFYLHLKILSEGNFFERLLFQKL